MTGFEVPPLAVDFNQLWVKADLNGGSGNWARRAAAELLSRPQWAGHRTPADEKRLTALLRQAGAIARAHGAAATAGFILIPSPADGIKGMAVVSPVDLAGREGTGAWDDLLQQLTPELSGDYPPDITPLQTKAGECRRLRMRYTSGNGHEQAAGEHIGYLWVFGDYGAAVIMSISFTSLPEAARWLPALDELAAGVRLQGGAGEGVSPGVAARPAPADGLVEIRPARPAGKLLPFESWYLGHWRLAADAGKGTLTLSGDRYLGRKTRVFPLATAGRADGVATVCLATHHWEIDLKSGSTWRMLLLDREGRLAGAGLARDHPQVLRLFPPEVFEPLTAIGIRVVSEWHDSGQALEDAHPGAAGKVALAGESRGKVAAIGLAGALLILIVVFLAVYLTR